MKIKSQRDFWSGLMFVVVGIAFAWGATTYSFGSSARPGPGYFPFGLGILLAVLGGLVLFKALTIEVEGGDRIGDIAWKPLAYIVGTVTVCGPYEVDTAPWAANVPAFRDRDTAHFHQFAVDPDLQRQGLGRRLVAACESWALQHGYKRMALDTAEPATQPPRAARRSASARAAGRPWASRAPYAASRSKGVLPSVQTSGGSLSHGSRKPPRRWAALVMPGSGD